MYPRNYFSKFARPFQNFVQAESFSGFLLLLFTVIALLWANSSLSDTYFGFWHSEFTFGINKFIFTRNLHFYINDLLMAVFFFVVGLEIKREVIAGELSTFKLATLPILAAAGGMLFPAILYSIFNAGTIGFPGWGIPTATDIAFALGILSLLGSKITVGLKVFLTALAIADDIGAILIIAVFYTTNLSFTWLLLGVIVLSFLILVNRLNIYSISPYIILGMLLWIALYSTGIHPTIAGVLTAMTIPSRNKIKGEQMEAMVKSYLSEYSLAFQDEKHPLSNEREQEGINAIDKITRDAQTPLKRLEDNLHPWVAYFIMPVFALANAGIVLKGDLLNSFYSEITLGIITGLVIGKPLGITFFSYLAVKFKLAQLPEDENWKRILGAGILGGIGFTMSIFISGLAFSDSSLIDFAKIGILSGSLIAGIIGYIMLRNSS